MWWYHGIMVLYVFYAGSPAAIRSCNIPRLLGDSYFTLMKSVIRCSKTHSRIFLWFRRFKVRAHWIIWDGADGHNAWGGVVFHIVYHVASFIDPWRTQRFSLIQFFWFSARVLSLSCPADVYGRFTGRLPLQWCLFPWWIRPKLTNIVINFL